MTILIFLLCFNLEKKHTKKHTESLKNPIRSVNARKGFIFMATVIENKKNGKTVSFKFRAYL
ncbi:MAG: hypothetical protein U0K91_10475, partial [Acutalibacteraceae bacterium]|nr:hypothetical protein [Acutalibacteraceae bacterium]